MPTTVTATARRRDRWRLGLAATAVLLAAADTYVVVVALPSIMNGVGVGLDRLQRATPPVPKEAVASAKADVSEIKERAHR